LQLLDAVLRKGLPLEAALAGATRDLDRPDDRAFVHAMVAETLRCLTDLDALIDEATAKPLPMDAKARFALRLALVQALRLETPPHAAIATILPLVDGGPRRLVHGVFGALMRREARLPDPPSLPVATTLRWREAWGDGVVSAAERAIASPPPLDISFPPGSPPDFEGTSLAAGHIRLPAGTAVTGLSGFGDGLAQWWVQDLAASIPARLLGAGDGRKALDLCAAPGGKTMQLAASGFRVTAIDVSKSRLARLAENFARTGLEAEIVIADVMKWSPPEAVDAILLDAPCSATGIFRRHPDVLYRARPKVIAEMAALQTAMLARAFDWLRRGGFLIYSVCSLEPAEGEAVAARLTESREDCRIDPIRAGELPAGLAPSGEGWLRILPGTLEPEGGCDSFFVARFERA